jgi:predicted DCC family thiol-disulfide oxidoreductase YuxK
VLYYDGACGMCRRSTTILQRMDWLGRLEFQDMTQVDAVALPVPIEAAMQGIPMRTHDGRTLIGFPAFRRAALQTPLGALPALIAYVPGVSHLGAMVYRWVATNRRRAVTCPRDQA